MKNVTLETAIKLKEAGWSQDPYDKGWYGTPGTTGYEIVCTDNDADIYHASTRFICAAPDATELLEALPLGVAVRKTSENRYVAYGSIYEHVEKPIHPSCGADTAAEALAALWLTLRAEGLI